MHLNPKQINDIALCAAQQIKMIKSGSFLIEGPDNDIIEQQVLEMAKGLLCSEGKTKDLYCKVCNNCQMLEAGSHPDLYWLRSDAGSSVIKIEEIRLLKERMSVKPFQSQKKIFIICEAERLNISAANALLKALEEPPEGVVIILITSSISQLLPTVISRCKRIRFSQEAAGDNPDFEGRDKLIAEFFEQGYNQRQKKLYERISDIDREQAGDLLQELVCVFRDILLIKVGAEAINFMSSQSGENLRVWAEKFSKIDVQMLIDKILSTKFYINVNANIKISMDLLIKTINKTA